MNGKLQGRVRVGYRPYTQVWEIAGHMRCGSVVVDEPFAYVEQPLAVSDTNYYSCVPDAKAKRHICRANRGSIMFSSPVNCEWLDQSILTCLVLDDWFDVVLVSMPKHFMA